MEPIGVVVMQGEFLLAEGLRTVLAEADDVVLRGEAGSLQEAEQLVRRHGPDVIVLDVDGVGPDSAATFSACDLGAPDSSIGIVVLAQGHDPESVFGFLSGGAGGKAYVLRDHLQSGEDLLRTVREVHEGRSVLGPRVLDAMIQARHRRRAATLAGLTPREAEVLAHMATGRDNSAIADGLVVSERTVEKHCNAIFGKLGLRDVEHLNRRVAAVLAYLAHSTN
ncbi:LuxR C-terminal-related transcriptional regulator [Euzebya tangerina]|uniref:LuxR C-terminal-related transcriptional regulator n=1 Tax=Euzebya tangerina TaxID=591198 RepID=UPI000E313EF5|nr:response regulator transcription factor [Euzebya tangerina]